MEAQTKVCKGCGIEKPLDEFHKDKYQKDGKQVKCKMCKNAQAEKWYEKNKEAKKEYNKEYREENKESVKECKKKYYEKNKEIIREYSKKYMKEYYEKNKEEIKERNKKWYEKNKEAKKEYNKEYMKKYFKTEKGKKIHNTLEQKRRAIKKALPSDLTAEQWEQILNDFENKCALTENIENVSLEHFLPLSIGHGGTTIGNVYPMNLNLNTSKNNKNPLKWIKTQDEKLQQIFYNVLIPYLAKQNGMDISTFKEFVNWCFKNPRTKEQVESDNEKGLNSIDLFYMSKNQNLAS